MMRAKTYRGNLNPLILHEWSAEKFRMRKSFSLWEKVARRAG